MIWVLVTKASISESIHGNPNYLELLQFENLCEAVQWGFSRYHSLIIDDQKQTNKNGKQTNEYSIWREDIEEHGYQFVEYDYHIIIYDGYVE